MIWIWYEINTCTQCTPPSGVMANVETLEQACSHHLLCEIMQHVCRELDINVSACSCSYSDCKMCFNTRKQHNKVSFLNWAGKSFECCLVKCCLMKMKPSVKEGHSESHMVWKLMARWSSIQKKKKKILPYNHTITTSVPAVGCLFPFPSFQTVHQSLFDLVKAGMRALLILCRNQVFDNLVLCYAFYFV